MAKYKGAEKCSPSALIQVGGTNFANMTDYNDLNSLEASAPAWHQNTMRAIKASGKVKDSDVMEQVMLRAPKPKKLKFGNGATARDVARGKRVTIIAASVGYTKKSHTPVHRVADSEGNVWLAKQNELKLIY